MMFLRAIGQRIAVGYLSSLGQDLSQVKRRVEHDSTSNGIDKCACEFAYVLVIVKSYSWTRHYWKRQRRHLHASSRTRHAILQTTCWEGGALCTLCTKLYLQSMCCTPFSHAAVLHTIRAAHCKFDVEPVILNG